MHASVAELFDRMRLDATAASDPSGLPVNTPIDGALLARLPTTTPSAFADAVTRAHEAQQR